MWIGTLLAECEALCGDFPAECEEQKANLGRHCHSQNPFFKSVPRLLTTSHVNSIYMSLLQYKTTLSQNISKLYKCLGKDKNQYIRQKTGTQNIVKGIKQCQEKWLHHVQRMDTNRLPKQALRYKPKGRRNIGRPRKRWRDQLHLEDQGTG